MSAAPISLQKVCTKNRAEELGLDVWQHFVVPLFYEELDLADASKPRIIIGGRGCGKTMLLRYLSHHSMFSPRRPEIPLDALHHLGLYWKIDTHFVNLMTKRGLDDEVWASAFDHYLAVVVALDVLRSLKSMAESRLGCMTTQGVREVRIRSLGDFDASLKRDDGGCPVALLVEFLEQRERQFQSWVNNPRKVPEPVFLPGKAFVLSLINELRAQLAPIRDSLFFVYIDEYENLREYQQRIINTYIKHSEPPLIVNVAMKRNGMRTPATVGDECITAIADYRPHDLDDYITEYNFELYAAEILFSRFATMANAHPIPVDVGTLRRTDALDSRRKRDYVSRVVVQQRGRFFRTFLGSRWPQKPSARSRLHGSYCRTSHEP